jgi:long-chain fatty acid transport protein
MAGHVRGQGLVIPGAGPVNRSMAGAGVAAPLDAAGALHWNPASITALPSSEFVVGVELLRVATHVGSSVGAWTGETQSDSGVNGLPAVAAVFKQPDSAVTYGLGLFSIGGFQQNYQGGFTNPIFSPPPPDGVGVGPAYSKLAVLQVVPTVAVQVTDRLSIGLAPTVVLVDAQLDPHVFAAPDPPGSFNYPPGTHARSHWGLGFQAGVYYEINCSWRVGASYKSPQWLEDITSYAGPARQLTLRADYPAIISVGTAFCGLPRTVWAVDFRYVDYDNTELFGHRTGYEPTGKWTGLGWRSVFSVATGVQYELSDTLSLRAGYVYSQNPIRDANTFFNPVSVAVYEHIVALGATYQISCRTGLTVAYLRAFENSIRGPWKVPDPNTGETVALDGTSVTARQHVDALVAGLQVRF